MAECAFVALAKPKSDQYHSFNEGIYILLTVIYIATVYSWELEATCVTVRWHHEVFKCLILLHKKQSVSYIFASTQRHYYRLFIFIH